MTTLAILIIGIFAGLFLFGVAAAIALLSYISIQQRRSAIESHAAMLRAVNHSTIAMDRMRGEVALALSSMDANRLHDASLTIQHGVKALQQTVDALGKLVFAAGVGDSTMGLDQAIQSNALTGVPSDAASNFYNPPPASRRFVQPDAPDPFLQWQERKKQEADLNSSSLPHATLPDIQTADGMEIDDQMSDAYLDEYISRRPNDDLPGVTDGSDAGPIGRG